MIGHIDQVFNAEILDEELTDTLWRLLRCVVVAYQEFSKKRPKWSKQRFENLIGHDSFASAIFCFSRLSFTNFCWFKWLLLSHLVKKWTFWNIVRCNISFLRHRHNMPMRINRLIFQLSQIHLLIIVLFNHFLQLRFNLDLFLFLRVV